MSAWVAASVGAAFLQTHSFISIVAERGEVEGQPKGKGHKKDF